MNICRWCGEEYPNQSDKEMFDAQLISTLKDRVKELEEALISIKNIFDEDGRYLETVSGVFQATSDIMVIVDKALLPKEKQDDRMD
jgi:hypothetical protein